MKITVIAPPNAKKIQRDLKLFPEKAKKIYGDAIMDAGIKYRDFVKQMRPVSAPRDGYEAKGIPLATGNLRRSIRSRRIMALAVGIGIGIPSEKYGAAVHEGRGKKVPGRPFFQWALEMGAEKEIHAIMMDASKKLP